MWSNTVWSNIDTVGGGRVSDVATFGGSRVRTLPGPQTWRPDLEPVFRRHYARVVAIAARVLGPGGQAEDVAQEVFVAFARSRIPEAEAGGWLGVAASHTALNAVRSGSRRSRREERAAVPETAPDDVAGAVLAADERARVRAVLAQMPRRQATVLLLRHGGWSYAEIADALGIAVGGVGTTLRRAEAAFRTELEHERRALAPEAKEQTDATH